MADPNRRSDGPPPSHIHVEDKARKTNWLAWLLLALGILALLFALSRCDRDAEVANVAPVVAPVADPVVAPVVTPAPLGTSGIGGYIAGTGTLPQTFTFEQLNFDTASSEVRQADREELTAIATTLREYPNARVRVVGYADARGASEANAALGRARADSVKAALVAAGLDAGRIETASGGETDPVDTNATAGGQAENRRTELVLLQR